MGRTLLTGLILCLFLAGCASRVSRKGVLSQDLPITLDDIREIRDGEENHKKVLQEYQPYDSPKLESYLNAIAASIAEVSTRPNLPYRVVILDDDQVNMFGGPGGFIYMTRGLLNFVESESEIAALIAHEIGHISHYEYAHVPGASKMKKAHSVMMKGTELARDSIGTYGTAAYYGVKGIGKVAPYVSRRFGTDAEVSADESAADYMLKAGYDPRGLYRIVERLSHVAIEDVGRFVLFMHTHPPFPARRVVLEEKLVDIDFNSGEIEFRTDKLSEVRQLSVNEPASTVFAPQMGVHQTTHMAIEKWQREKSLRSTAARRRGGWF